MKLVFFSIIAVLFFVMFQGVITQEYRYKKPAYKYRNSMDEYDEGEIADSNINKPKRPVQDMRYNIFD
ncbi:unnamed protein product [Phyllotreta striolata]|uniref:Uncharacterized protein n=1 Tax=Phyllotreta striolata TaxID=444603 RepID=A0A9N9XJI4_PHYSR|nr:unnamed protein product [Phyllotreta striolata]